MTEPKANPIIDRIDKLREAWWRFCDDEEKRLLVWCLHPEDLSIRDTFLSVEMEEQGETAELFVRIEAAFEVDHHGFSIVDHLLEAYAAAKVTLAELGLPDAWAPPPPTPGQHDIERLVAVCTHFMATYGEAMEHLVLVLDPAEIADEAAWQDWLSAAASAAFPESVRLLTTEVGKNKRWHRLHEQPPAAMLIEDPQLDGETAAADLAAAADDGSPGGRFRRAFIEIGAAGKERDQAEAEHAANRALSISRAEKWPAMSVVAHIALSSVQISCNDHEAAVRTCEAASAEAQDAAAAKVEGGDQLVLQTGMSLGSAYIGVGRYAPAAATYEETIAAAVSVGNSFLELECRRLACFCYETADDPEPAWHIGLSGLAQAQTLSDEERRNSYLPYLGAGLLRIAERHQYTQPSPKEIRATLCDLVGPEWEEQAGSVGGAP
ncbi:ATP-binding protein [Acanthopleuribacter pedis]|uniref:ATP-binding protein n=1 Tax=Acanthopleuribacter pedis TaxID=442870 RepID=A0A8J7U713_9BACT|nr:ATP-binding protein [Acanthopleuribacter pedis]MBO1322514.1 ATP-binding protein [Acanthopleuribacter pedis]